MSDEPFGGPRVRSDCLSLLASPHRYGAATDAVWALALLLAPLVMVIHPIGTVAGILGPPTSFRATKKVRSA
jgi:hypothetical protein